MNRLVVRGWARVAAELRAEGASRLGAVRAVWPEAPARVERTDRASAFALMVAGRALARAGYDPATGDGLGVFVGTALGCIEANERFHRSLVVDGAANASPRLFTQTIPSGPAGEISIAHGARGHALTVMAGPASGLAALVEARRALALGRCDAALVVAGDVLGDDSAPLLARDGVDRPAESMVALYLDDGRRGGGVAVIEHVAVHATLGAHDPRTPDWLGASALLELTRWLDAPTPAFDVEVAAHGGFGGGLRARYPAAVF